ncbi:plasmid SOS inhibition protein A [Erwinia amylovora]|uniref:plasmid SOS inhibition protein A n=2 Tax=Erwinia amylovora TaxID=552 RepID=UPI0013052A2E|nr:plasmid SOS inhibition protein A [Erwinia amylovora]
MNEITLNISCSADCLQRRAKYHREMAWQILAARAESELAFHTPDTVRSWCYRWARTPVAPADIDSMLCRWGELFPSVNWPDSDGHTGQTDGDETID